MTQFMIIMHHWSRIPKDRVHYEQKRSRIGARSLFSLRSSTRWLQFLYRMNRLSDKTGMSERECVCPLCSGEMTKEEMEIRICSCGYHVCLVARF